MDLYAVVLALAACMCVCAALAHTPRPENFKEVPGLIIGQFIEGLQFTYEILIRDFFAVRLAGYELAGVSALLMLMYWPQIWQTTLTGAAFASAVAL